MTPEYAEFVKENAATAEHALFDLRNALRGTGIAELDRLAREVDSMRQRCARIMTNRHLKE